jgi:uncharacterized membrane-anchored protein
MSKRIMRLQKAAETVSEVETASRLSLSFLKSTFQLLAYVFTKMDKAAYKRQNRDRERERRERDEGAAGLWNMRRVDDLLKDVHAKRMVITDDDPEEDEDFLEAEVVEKEA